MYMWDYKRLAVILTFAPKCCTYGALGIGKFVNWRIDELVNGGNRVIAEIGKLENWKIGKLENWKIGRLEDWKIGKLENWKIGKLENWKIAR